MLQASIKYHQAMSALPPKVTAKADGHFRFIPNSGHVQCNSVCPLCANSGHWLYKKKDRHAAASPKSETAA
jgi:hypothetical protein